MFCFVFSLATQMLRTYVTELSFIYNQWLKDISVKEYFPLSHCSNKIFPFCISPDRETSVQLQEGRSFTLLK